MTEKGKIPIGKETGRKEQFFSEDLRFQRLGISGPWRGREREIRGDPNQYLI